MWPSRQLEMETRTRHFSARSARIVANPRVSLHHSADRAVLEDPRLWSRLSPGSNRLRCFRELLARSSRIAAHQRISARIPDRRFLRRHYEIPASCHIRSAWFTETGVVAMQKVVGSNPISRFFANHLHGGGSGPAQIAETKWNHPRISPPFWALVPGMARIRRD